MTIVRINYRSLRSEVVLEVPTHFGDAAGVARRLRSEGVPARRKGDEVVIEVA